MKKKEVEMQLVVLFHFHSAGGKEFRFPRRALVGLQGKGAKFVCTSHGVWPQAFDLSPLVVTGRHQRFQLSGWSELALQPLREKEGQDLLRRRRKGTKPNLLSHPK